jgi:hypothetical protein
MFIAGTVPVIFVGMALIVQPSPQPGHVGGFIIFVLLSVLAYSVAYIMLAVACHRCVLLAERNLDFAEWGARVIRYAFQAFLVALLSSIPAIALFFLSSPLLSSLLPKNPTTEPVSTEVLVTMFLVTFAIYIPTAYVAGRLSLVLPAVAVDRKLTLTESFSLTEGNGWRLAVLLGLIPVGIPLALEQAVAFAVGKVTESASVAWAWGFFNCYFLAACLMVAAAILSTSFRELAERDFQPNK